MSLQALLVRFYNYIWGQIQLLFQLEICIEVRYLGEMMTKKQRETQEPNWRSCLGFWRQILFAFIKKSIKQTINQTTPKTNNQTNNQSNNKKNQSNNNIIKESKISN